MITDTELRVVAQSIRLEFLDRKAEALNTNRHLLKLRTSEDNPQLWDKAARICLEEGATPEDFVLSAFESTRASQGPYGNMMGSESTRKWYRNFKTLMSLDDEDRGFKNSGEFQFNEDMMCCLSSLKKITGSLDLDDYSLMLLRRPYTGYPAYIRVILAPGDDEIIKQWGEKALKQLLDPQLQKAAEDQGVNVEELKEWIRERI